MDSFRIHGRMIDDYRGYIESFINIRDDEICAVVDKALSEGRLWPEPLIQLNPSYEITRDLAEGHRHGVLEAPPQYQGCQQRLPSSGSLREEICLTPS